MPVRVALRLRRATVLRLPSWQGIDRLRSVPCFCSLLTLRELSGLRDVGYRQRLENATRSPYPGKCSAKLSPSPGNLARLFNVGSANVFIGARFSEKVFFVEFDTIFSDTIVNDGNLLIHVEKVANYDLGTNNDNIKSERSASENRGESSNGEFINTGISGTSGSLRESTWNNDRRDGVLSERGESDSTVEGSPLSTMLNSLLPSPNRIHNIHLFVSTKKDRKR